MVLIGAVNRKMSARSPRRRHGASVALPTGLNLAYDAQTDEVLIEK
jgi:hypothetical protein